MPGRAPCGYYGGEILARRLSRRPMAHIYHKKVIRNSAALASAQARFGTAPAYLYPLAPTDVRACDIQQAIQLRRPHRHLELRAPARPRGRSRASRLRSRRRTRICRRAAPTRVPLTPEWMRRQSRLKSVTIGRRAAPPGPAHSVPDHRSNRFRIRSTSVPSFNGTAATQS